ncbi:Maf family protein [Paenibacillus ihumii]|uniref:Maf family protein n=1 Tax=Paenibacillus ihumii TaxID=687436 RepID=UPI0006D7EDA7|nr:Maf family protein [Paenibacillus ihumii]
MELAASSPRHVILASTSPRRRELLATLHIPFEVVPSKADEAVPSEWAPEQVVLELALRKAKAVHAALDSESRNAVIIGSDTIVVLDGQVLGKPKNEGEAASMLRALQGRSHQVLTAVACIDAGTGRAEAEYRRTIVTMRPAAEEEIAAYARTGEGLDKAGAYAIQGLGAIFVTGIEGCYFNVVGLPLSLLSEMLGRFGIPVLK